MLITLPPELIWTYIFYLYPKDIYHLQLCHHYFVKEKITRVNINYTLGRYLGLSLEGTTSTNSYIINSIQEGYYTFTSYIDDIHTSLCNESIYPINKRPFRFARFHNKQYFSYNIYRNIYKSNKQELFYQLLRYNENTIDKMKNIIVHPLYRVPLMVYIRIKNNNTIKALIY